MHTIVCILTEMVGSRALLTLNIFYLLTPIRATTCASPLSGSGLNKHEAQLIRRHITPVKTNAWANRLITDSKSIITANVFRSIILPNFNRLLSNVFPGTKETSDRLIEPHPHVKAKPIETVG